MNPADSTACRQHATRNQDLLKLAWSHFYSMRGKGLTFSLPSLPFVSQAQPLPNWVAPAALNCFLNSSNDPKSRSIASFSSPSGSSAQSREPFQ